MDNFINNESSSIMRDDSYDHDIEINTNNDIYIKISSIEEQLKNITTTYLTLIQELTVSNNKLIQNNTTTQTYNNQYSSNTTQQTQSKNIYFHIISYIDEDENCLYFTISGKTYDVRDILKQKGGQWDKDTKGWKFDYTCDIYNEIYDELKKITDDIKIKKENV